MVLIILISSKSGLITLLIILAARVLQEFYIHKNYIRITAMGAVGLLTLSILYFKFPKSLERIKEMKHAVLSAKVETNTTSSRIAIWQLHGCLD